MPSRIAAAIATHRRDAELARLLSCLAASTLPLEGGIFVADNAASTTTRHVCASAPLPAAWLPRQRNNGPGPAWNTAITAALADASVTHVLVLDDDVVPPPDTTLHLLEAMGDSAALAAPLLFDGEGNLWGFPEPVDEAQRKVIRRVHRPAECRAVFGREPHALCWATGACLLFARRAFERDAFREDFWMLGEDLEFSMRTASRLGGVFTAAAAVPHIPPSATKGASGAADRMKFLALLQNLSYLAVHSPHSAHLRWYLPGNFRRYLRTFGWSPGNLRDALDAFRLGARRGLAAGDELGHALRHRAARRVAPAR